ncbi:PH domain-containing protein [Methylorubrum extorquens]|uniref:PH domain-containing protein n=1 Tax=Methylorubrum extorquens TaxID=408 RepID=UPI0022378BB8|nr:PH domain-containing protein [Methylorubrum extorquens]UYW24475.1 PH domain-containing protein [Methylorubrum extorquens]UYW30702.1 PH domain-containing protein [Methylorubrum extorquens]
MTEKPLATYRPVFVLWMALLQQVPLQLFFTVWAAGFFGGMYHEAFGASTTLANSLAAIGSVVFIGFPVVVVISRAMNYRTTRYRLYPDRIEIDEGFLTIHAKRLMFRDICEASLRRGVLQRSIGLGSVCLDTRADGALKPWSLFNSLGLSSTVGSGAMIRDIPDADQAYERLRGLIDAARRD